MLCPAAHAADPVADLADLHRTNVESIERRERNASLDNIERIALALGVDIVDLLSPACVPQDSTCSSTTDAELLRMAMEGLGCVR